MYFKIVPFRLVFVLFTMLEFLAACTPTTNKPPTLALISTTPTPELATFMPQPTSTTTHTPTIALPSVDIPVTPTQGVNSITKKNAKRIKTLGSVGFSKAYDTDWSPNNELLAIETSLGLAFYDTETWNQVKLLDPSISDKFKWSPNGKLLFTAYPFSDEPQTVSLFDGETLEQIKVFKNGGNFSLSPNGDILAIMGDRKTFFMT
jgi:hypothetical protein